MINTLGQSFVVKINLARQNRNILRKLFAWHKACDKLHLGRKKLNLLIEGWLTMTLQTIF